MDIERLREYCLGKPYAMECFPFDEDTLVFKVGRGDKTRMFAYISLEKASVINLKCDPDRAVELRERYAGIEPGFHMNKRHWNSVDTSGSLDDALLKELIDHSYNLTRRALPKYIRETLLVGTPTTGSNAGCIDGRN